MKGIARLRRTSWLGVALLFVSTTGAGCFRTPLGDAHSPAADGSADHPGAPNLTRSDADVPPDIALDLSSDPRPDLAPDLRPDLAPYGEPPAVAFLSVSAGTYFACGLKTDSTLACWGDNSAGEATPPAGAFASVSAGAYFACGLRTDSTIACWGNNSDGQATIQYLHVRQRGLRVCLWSEDRRRGRLLGLQLGRRSYAAVRYHVHVRQCGHPSCLRRKDWRHRRLLGRERHRRDCATVRFLHVC